MMGSQQQLLAVSECGLSPRRMGGEMQVEYFFRLLQGQRSGRGVLPFYLGLEPEVWGRVVKQYSSTGNPPPGISIENADAQQDLRQELLELRRDEWRDIRDLLAHHQAGIHPLENAMADIVAAGCLGGDHLWRDLGCTDRSQLGELLHLFFPDLAKKNTKDMKWKKFFYKQLCEQEGGYVCRAPSCEVCAAYSDCFGEEH